MRSLSKARLFVFPVVFALISWAGTANADQQGAQSCNPDVQTPAARLLKVKDKAISAVGGLAADDCDVYDTRNDGIFFVPENKKICEKAVQNRAVILEALQNMSITVNPSCGHKVSDVIGSSDDLLDHIKGPYKSAKSNLASDFSMTNKGVDFYNNDELMMSFISDAVRVAGVKDNPLDPTSNIAAVVYIVNGEKVAKVQTAAEIAQWNAEDARISNAGSKGELSQAQDDSSPDSGSQPSQAGGLAR